MSITQHVVHSRCLKDRNGKRNNDNPFDILKTHEPISDIKKRFHKKLNQFTEWKKRLRLSKINKL